MMVPNIKALAILMLVVMLMVVRKNDDCNQSGWAER